MRCSCCNKNLNDYESTLRSPITNMFLDMCTKCVKIAGIAAVGNTNFDPSEKMEDETYNDDNLFDDYADQTQV